MHADSKCASRNMHGCVCLQTPGSGSHCLWSANESACVDRGAWEGDGDKCGALPSELECKAVSGAFTCSWERTCAQPCGGRGGGMRCCAWGERCIFSDPKQPTCNAP